MACSIVRNEKNGNIVNVLAENGKPSKLFKDIHSNIFLGDATLSTRIYLATQTDDLVKSYQGRNEFSDENGEPKLFYKDSKGQIQNSLEKALLQDDIAEMSMGIMNPKTGEFMPIASFNPMASEKSAFLASQVQEGTLSAERYLNEDGKTFLRGKGEFNETRMAMARAFKHNAQFEKGYGNITLDPVLGTIDMLTRSDLTIAENVDGTSEVIQIKEVLNKIDEGKNFENKVDLLTEYLAETDQIRPLTTENKKVSNDSEKAILNTLNNFLKAIGFTTTTLDNYVKNYKSRVGVDADVNALADLANKVLAFKEGRISVELLGEEVAHIALEAYSDQNSIISILADVVETEEYKQYAEYYRQKYSENYEGVELEDQVRKEILGKILAKKIIDNFNTENTSEVKSGIIQSLKDIWNRFKEFLKNNVRPSHSKALDELNNRIANFILENQTDKFQKDLTDNRNFFYNAMSSKALKIEDSLKNARTVLQQMYQKALDGEKSGQLKALENISDVMDEMNILSSVNTIIDITDVQLSNLEAGIKQSQKSGKPISKIDRNRYDVLSENLIPVLAVLKKQLETNKFTSDYSKEKIEDFSKAIEDINTRKFNIDPDINAELQQRAEQVASDLINQGYLSEEEREQEIAKLKGNFRDATMMSRYFGLMSHSKNPFIQTLARLVAKLDAATTRKFTDVVNRDLKYIYDKKLNALQRNIIKRDANGKQTHYYWSMIDWNKYAEDFKKVQIDLLAKASGKTQEVVKKELERKSPAEIVGNEQKYLEYKRLEREWKNKEGLEQRFKEAYYEKRDKNFDDLGISQASRDYLSTQNLTISQIEAKYRDKKTGRIDRTKLTERDKEQVANHRKSKKVKRSIFDSFGNIKKGLDRKNVSEMTDADFKKMDLKDKDFENWLRTGYKGFITIADSNTTSVDLLSEDARITYDLNLLTLRYLYDQKEQTKTGKPIQAFLDRLLDIKNEGGDTFNWMMENGSISLNDTYFDSIEVGANLSDVVERYSQVVDTHLSDTARLFYNDLKDLQRKRRDILKQNAKVNNGMETDVNNIHGLQMTAIIELDESIAQITNELYNLEGFREVKDTFPESKSNSVRQVNEDYEKMKRESGLSDFDFVMKHITNNYQSNKLQDSKVVKMSDFSRQMWNLLNGKKLYTKQAYEDFFEQILETNDANGNPLITPQMSNAEVLEVLKNEFAKTQVPSYFTRFTPEGYDSLINDLKNGNVEVLDILENKEALYDKHPVLRNLDFNADPSWTEDLDMQDNMNPNFQEGGYYVQPRLDKYVDDTFFSRYGISKSDWLKNPTMNLSELTATKNTDEFEMLKTAISWREQALELYGDTQEVNKFQRPQITSSTFEKVARIKNTFDIGEVKDFVKDIYQNRIDEKMFGEQDDEGENLANLGIKIIPKYFNRQVEDATSLTESTITAGLLDLQQAIKYSEKKRIEGDMKAVEAAIANQEFVQNNGSRGGRKIAKEGAVSNYYAKAKEYLDFHLYGVQQTRSFVANFYGRDVDLTRVVNKIQGFARFSNLAFNPFVDLTSATTGIINNAMDRVAGDFYHKSSANRANSIMLSIFPKFAEEAGKLYKTSTLNKLQEFMGLESTGTRLSNSSFGRGMRLLEKSPYLLSKLANQPVNPKAMLSVLCDFRYSDGHYRTFNQFTLYQRAQNATISQKEIEIKWKALEKDSAYDILDTTKDSVTYNQKFLDQFEGNKVLADVAFEELHERIMSMAKQVAEGVDGVVNEIDQVAAQRDMLLNVFMMHRGWFLLNLTRRFKSKHFNLATGQVEEGHYITTARLVKNVIGGAISPASLKDFMNNLSPQEARNVKRALVETATASFLMLMGAFILAGDDEDDSELEDLAQLIYMRTVSEFNTAQWFGVSKSVIETAKSPFVAINTIEAFEPVSMVQKLFSEDSEGNNKWTKTMKKITPLRRVDQLSDLRGTLSSFRHFNSPTLMWLGDEYKDSWLNMEKTEE